MYNMMKSPDEIDVRYLPIADDSDLTMSFHTTNKRSLGDLLDFLLPSATIKEVDSLGNDNYNVVVSFESKSDMMSFVSMFAPNDLWKRERYLRKYKEQKNKAVL